MENCLVTIVACLIFFAAMVLLAPAFAPPPPTFREKISAIKSLAKEISEVTLLAKLVLSWTIIRIFLIPSVVSAIISSAFLLSMAAIAAICAPESTPAIVKHIFDRAFDLLETIAILIFAGESG